MKWDNIKTKNYQISKIVLKSSPLPPFHPEISFLPFFVIIFPPPPSLLLFVPSKMTKAGIPLMEKYEVISHLLSSSSNFIPSLKERGWLMRKDAKIDLDYTILVFTMACCWNNPQILDNLDPLTHTQSPTTHLDPLLPLLYYHTLFHVADFWLHCRRIRVKEWTLYMLETPNTNSNKFKTSLKQESILKKKFQRQTLGWEIDYELLPSKNFLCVFQTIFWH